MVLLEKGKIRPIKLFFFMLVIVASSIIFLAGCSSHTTNFSLLATKKLDYRRMQKYRKAPRSVIGQDRTGFFLFIPLGKVSKISFAIEDALKNIPGAVGLIDGSIHYNFWSFIIFSRSSYTVHGTPLINLALRRRQIPSGENEPPVP